MADEEKVLKVKHVNKAMSHDGSGFIYVLGILGALAYFLQRADSFWEGVVGIGKALFWPAVVVYEVLKLLNL